ncbi:hypothetical protein J5N97_004436 [Dioscorea zingiberensis]|uniref:Uncharacterized protein n=1 Tax=Dioscorea zingiberensis TaxID=325984 RepID=A0A9D5D8J0_9LILI|nr:hypothetical protein J5N97_004436 [Dioscorea zingiberensis]
MDGEVDQISYWLQNPCNGVYSPSEGGQAFSDDPPDLILDLLRWVGVKRPRFESDNEVRKCYLTAPFQLSGRRLRGARIVNFPIFVIAPTHHSDPAQELRHRRKYLRLASSSSSNEEEVELGELKGIELRLGLLGSESPDRKNAARLNLGMPRSSVSRAKRGFLDTVNGPGSWAFAGGGGSRG